MRKEQGFTLIEILVALTIFTLLAAIVATGLYTTITASQKNKQLLEQLSNLQITQALLFRDITQILDRPIIDEAGQKQPPVIGDTTGKVILEFTTISYSNPFSLTQTNIQRVAYVLIHNTLYRQTWLAIDRMPGTSFRHQELIGNLAGVNAKFLDRNNQLRDHWPLTDKTTLPKAIEVELTFLTGEKLQQLFIIEASAASSDEDKQQTK